jgi:preprotein translocase subunit SecF
MQIFKNPNYNFVRWRWHALALSLVVILAGAALIATRGGLQLGVEFSGGTVVVLKFDQPADVGRVREALRSMPGGTGDDAIVQYYGEPAEHRVMIRVAAVGAESGGSLSEAASAIERSVKEANVGSFVIDRTEIVGPIVGDQLKKQGTMATILALCGILLYIALRFQFSFALGAVAATIHDLLVTLAFLTFFEYDITLNVIAAILTITGYSVNDTIVVFDRVRENQRLMRRASVAEMINRAVNQTLSRTVITAGTTFLAVLALFIFGGEVLRGMSFTLLVGIVTGTYSTIFIASAVAIFFTRSRGTTAGGAQAPPQARARRARD